VSFTFTRRRIMALCQDSTEITHRSMPYHVPRGTLIWAWWRRLMLSRRTLIALSIWAAIAIACLFLPGQLSLLGLLPTMFLLLAPINVYQLYAKSVDNEPQLTDEKILEFSRSRLAFTGPDWRNEMTWKRFKGASEDTHYFHLELRHSALPGLVPKSALTPEQQQLLREYAANQNT
jgi:hypothetical protein